MANRRFFKRLLNPENVSKDLALLSVAPRA